MISLRNANAMAEVIYYLKGIKKEDIDKIPQNFIQYLNENASKEYKCNFDYNKPLKELDLLDDTRGIIGMICYNYWCITEIQKEQYLQKLRQNEKIYQEILHEKYNSDNLFKNKKEKNIYDNIAMIEYKETVLTKLKKWVKNIFNK